MLFNILKGISRCLSAVSEYKWNKQLSGFKLMPSLEKFSVETDIVLYIGETAGIARRIASAITNRVY